MHKALVSPVEKLRHSILRDFVNHEESSISLGCGGYEPAVIGTRYASDVQQRAEKYLRSVGFRGEFTQADIRALPFKNKQFKIAVASEVIEHLDTEGDVVLALYETNRVAKSWIISTPHYSCDDPDHKFHFTENQLNKLFVNIPHEIFIKGHFFYITNDKEKLSAILSKYP